MKRIALKTVEFWVVQLTCVDCAAEEEFRIGEKSDNIPDLDAALARVPTESWNSWLVASDVLCPGCVLKRAGIQIRKTTWEPGQNEDEPTV